MTGKALSGEKYKAYPEYKESGVEWLPELPANWKIERTKRMFSLKRCLVGNQSSNYQLLSLTLKGVIPRDISSGEGKIPESFDTYQKVDENDLIFCLFDIDETPRTIGISPLNGMITGAYNVYGCLEHCYSDYAYYYFFHIDSFKGLKPFYTGLRKVVRAETFSNIEMPCPSFEEQQKIASFLDHETAKIDTLIAKQEKLIELLKEKRQAVISHAVTKGLNPNAPMRDSGVEWLGEVPKHWEIKKIKHCASLISSKQKIDGQPVIALENIEGLTGDFVATNSNYNGEDVAFLEGDILFGKLRPYLAKVFLCQKSGIAFGDLLTYRPNQKTESSFLFYTMISSWFIEMVDSSTYGAKMPRASSEFVNEMFICFPPLEEQKTIYKELDTILQHFKTLTDKANKAIELMKERKTALISAAVTGKIDVRDFVSEQGQPQGV